MTSTPTIPLAGAEVPRVGLGTNRLTPTDDNVAFLREAVDAGLRHVDTAHLYTGGGSEETIGAALADRSDDLVIATKGGYRRGEGRPGPLREQIEQSLRALRTDAIALWYLHRVDPETPLEDTLGAVREHVERGVIRHVGLSQVGVEEIDRDRGVVEIAAVQNEYNLGDLGHDEVVDHCEREGIAFVPFFPLRGGDRAALSEIAGRHGVTENAVRLARLPRPPPGRGAVP